ncbi:MAG: hypothetical protein ACKV2Q_01085 [Planctomycetaceae bacterium]
MDCVLIGYFPKQRMTRSQWRSPYPDYPDAGFPSPDPVEEICSASNCIAKGPDSWNEAVPFNYFGGFDSLASALRVLPADLRHDFDVFAYRMAPILFRDGQAEELEVPEQILEPLPVTFECIGCDAVELRGYGRGCSPLSCNGQAGEGEVVVNRYCLVATQSEAIELARRFSDTKPEPGPYCVVEVWKGCSRVSQHRSGI